ncbi:MAG: transglutaminase domain-containing protein [Planctomycetaceae bacterium]|nr:transglutaminase domain-containing protein [Planctomycetaceae bacterium]
MVLILLLGACQSGSTAITAEPARQTVTFTARDLFEQSTVRHVEFASEADGLRLSRGTVIEDDGPAAGYSYQPDTLRLSEGTVILKQLLVEDPRADGALLLVARGGELKFTINGQSAQARLLGKQGAYWQAWKLDPGLLKAGRNDIEISGTGQILLARAENFAAGSQHRTTHPDRSARSTTGGKSWDSSNLLGKDDVDGEYCVRLALDQFDGDLRQTGSRTWRVGRVQLPVIDLADLTGRGFGSVAAKQLRLSLQTREPEGTMVQVLYRSGETPAGGGAGWTEWQPLQLDQQHEASPAAGAHRWLQVAVELLTESPQSSPALQQVQLSGVPVAGEGWSTEIRQTSGAGELPVLTGIPFVYESFSQPLLARFRREQKLDQVVEGAETELELLSKLAAWSSASWPGLGHIGKIYPAWNAFEILAPHEDGTPVGGFCQQYNLVFLQACQSFGIPARIVSIGPGTQLDRIRGGHETVEVWSNQFRRWMYFDGNTAWYTLDQQSGNPLSLRALRQRQQAVFNSQDSPSITLRKVAETRYEWKGLDSWPALMELRLVPRSDFFARSSPLPLNQGMRGWFWTGHAVWSDDLLPDRNCYPCRIRRPADWEWPVNTVHAVLTPLEKPGTVQVTFLSHTPGFQRFELTEGSAPTSSRQLSGSRVSGLSRDDPGHLAPLVDSVPPAGGTALETARDLVLGESTWTLQPGENLLRVRSVNVLDRAGPESEIRIRWEPGTAE